MGVAGRSQRRAICLALLLLLAEAHSVQRATSVTSALHEGAEPVLLTDVISSTGILLGQDSNLTNRTRNSTTNSTGGNSTAPNQYQQVNACFYRENTTPCTWMNTVRVLLWYYAFTLEMTRQSRVVIQTHKAKLNKPITITDNGEQEADEALKKENEEEENASKPQQESPDGPDGQKKAGSESFGPKTVLNFFRKLTGGGKEKEGKADESSEGGADTEKEKKPSPAEFAKKIVGGKWFRLAHSMALSMLWISLIWKDLDGPKNNQEGHQIIGFVVGLLATVVELSGWRERVDPADEDWEPWWKLDFIACIIGTIIIIKGTLEQHENVGMVLSIFMFFINSSRATATTLELVRLDRLYNMQYEEDDIVYYEHELHKVVFFDPDAMPRTVNVEPLWSVDGSTASPFDSKYNPAAKEAPLLQVEHVQEAKWYDMTWCDGQPAEMIAVRKGGLLGKLRGNGLEWKVVKRIPFDNETGYGQIPKSLADQKTSTPPVQVGEAVRPEKKDGSKEAPTDPDAPPTPEEVATNSQDVKEDTNNGGGIPGNINPVKDTEEQQRSLLLQTRVSRGDEVDEEGEGYGLSSLWDPTELFMLLETQTMVTDKDGKDKNLKENEDEEEKKESEKGGFKSFLTKIGFIYDPVTAKVKDGADQDNHRWQLVKFDLDTPTYVEVNKKGEEIEKSDETKGRPFDCRVPAAKGESWLQKQKRAFNERVSRFKAAAAAKKAAIGRWAKRKADKKVGKGFRSMGRRMNKLGAALSRAMSKVKKKAARAGKGIRKAGGGAVDVLTARKLREKMFTKTVTVGYKQPAVEPVSTMESDEAMDEEMDDQALQNLREADQRRREQEKLEREEDPDH